MSINSPANQHTPDDRQQPCWELYVESVIAGTPNACRAALAAGYSEAQANNITVQGWFIERLEKLRRKEMLSKAEKVLEEMLVMPVTDEEGKRDSAFARIKQDTAKFIASTQGKDQGYSNRTEMTGKDGADLGVIQIPQK